MAVLAGAGIYEARQAAQLHQQNQTLLKQQVSLEEQLVGLRKEHDKATNLLASVREDLAKGNKIPAEVLKLRGQVGVLHEANRAAGEKSALNKITSNPETRQLMRDQQKRGMSIIFNDYAKMINFSPEQSGQFNELLADYVMGNVDLITQVLHDGNTSSEIDRIFSDAESALLNSIQSQFGEEAVTKYQEYSKNLISSLTVMQFAGELMGDSDERRAKDTQLQQLIQQEAALALQNAGLPADYQVVPILNFRNIASEATGNASIALLDGIYANVAAKSSSFLTPEEIASFQTFRTNAFNNSLTALTMNRKLMAPLAQ